MLIDFRPKLSDSLLFQRVEKTLIFDILQVRKNRQEVFSKNWNESSPKKKIIIWFSLMIIYTLIVALLLNILYITVFLIIRHNLNGIDLIFPLTAPCTAFLWLSLQVGYFKISQPYLSKKIIKASTLPIIYISFVIYSSLCFIRLCFSLPLLLNKPNDSKFLETSSYDTYLDLSNDFLSYSHLSFLYSFSMKIVILFILSRLGLNLFHGIPEMKEMIEKAKRIWVWTVTTWGVLFTILTTISIVWVATIGK